MQSRSILHMRNNPVHSNNALAFIISPKKRNSSIFSGTECSPEALGGGRNSIEEAFELGKHK